MLCNARHFHEDQISSFYMKLLADKQRVRDMSLKKEDTTKFWTLSASGFGSRNVLKHSLTLQDR